MNSNNLHELRMKAVEEGNLAYADRITEAMESNMITRCEATVQKYVKRKSQLRVNSKSVSFEDILLKDDVYAIICNNKIPHLKYNHTFIQ